MSLERRTRMLFVWTGLASYMADCWRRLAAASGVDLKVWIDVSGAGAKAVDFNAADLMHGLDYAICRDVSDLPTLDWRPDVIFAVGWHSAICRAVVRDGRFADIPKVCCFDMPWRWRLRCLLAPFVLGGFLRRYRAAFVPGGVCARYARWLGFRKVYRGLFSIDVKRFSRSLIPDSAAGSSNRYFLYMGRDSSEKRLGDLRAAHGLYRSRGGGLEMRLYGKGLEGGFASPENVPALMRNAAAVVLASEFDPWPLVLLEAMSAGCPVIASDRCTNRPELGENWRVFKCGDVEGLAQALFAVERHADWTDAAARRKDHAIAMEYDCDAWVGRVLGIAGDLCPS